MNTVIGIDFGTQSARALLVNAADGAVLRSLSIRYPRGIFPSDLVSAEDYLETLDRLLTDVTAQADRRSIRGVCIDATSLTLVCLSPDGRPVEKLPGFAGREQALVKLWKRHHAEPQAEEALRLARELDEPFLRRTGGTISSEWTLPKILEIRDKDPEVYGRIDLALDLCEFLTYTLTGSLARSSGSMCYKGLWAGDLGFPSEGYLNRLRPGFADEYRRLLRGEVYAPGQRVGLLRPELAQRYGLTGEITVAAGLLDGHTAQVALGATRHGDAALVVGTSNVLSVQTKLLQEVDGVCGVAMDAQLPGLCGIDSGQACTGDMLAWYVENALPASVLEEADQAGVSVHELLSRRITQPWTCDLTAVDWWNGSRNVPCDLTQRGCIWGLSLQTAPEMLYLALLQGIVCGTREIVEQCARSGVEVQRFFAAGGVAARNPLLMQEYANILHRSVHVGRFTEGPALGSAIFAAVAAGLYPDAEAACRCMGVKDFTVYTPDLQHGDEYEQIYRRSHALRQMMQKFSKG